MCARQIKRQSDETDGGDQKGVVSKGTDKKGVVSKGTDQKGGCF